MARLTTGGTLSFRISVILLAGFVLMQVLLVIVLQLPGRIQDRPYGGLPSPPAFAQLVRSVDAAGPDGARRLVANFDESVFSVDLRTTAPTDYREVPARLTGIARAYRRAVSDHNVVVDGGPGRFAAWFGNGSRSIRLLTPIRVTVWLRSGQVLVLTGRPAAGLRAYLAQRSILSLIGGVVLLAVSWLALRQTTRPLQRLTRRVNAFGKDLNAADATIEGSREIATLATAFNDMKRRIGALVDERTFLLAGIAHDMRTYLTRLRLRAEYIDDPDQYARADRDLEQMSALLDDSLLFAGLGQGARSETRVVDLSMLTRKFAALRADADQPRIHVDGPDTLLVQADPVGLERVFGNLVDNGLRHGTSVTIRIAIEDRRAVWLFKDDGPGVPADDLARLGTAYMRLDPSRDRRSGGAGLGLAIVRGLIGAMDGAVTFRSAPGEGLEVAISLPRA